MAIYMKFDNIEGDATAEAHKKEITLDSVSFEADRAVLMEVGSTANRVPGDPQIGAVTISKGLCSASVQLYQSLVDGIAGSTVTIFITETGEDRTYVEIGLTNAMVSSYSVGSDKKGRGQEHISISYTKIGYSYTSYDSDNIAAIPVRVEYDLAKKKA